MPQSIEPIRTSNASELDEAGGLAGGPPGRVSDGVSVG